MTLRGVTKPRSKLVKDENRDLLADFQNIFNRYKKYFPQLLNINRKCDVRQIEIHRVQPLLFDTRPFEVAIGIAKLKRYKSQGNN
jgi:hypothetical protein